MRVRLSKVTDDGYQGVTATAPMTDACTRISAALLAHADFLATAILDGRLDDARRHADRAAQLLQRLVCEMEPDRAAIKVTS